MSRREKCTGCKECKVRCIHCGAKLKFTMYDFLYFILIVWLSIKIIDFSDGGIYALFFPIFFWWHHWVYKIQIHRNGPFFEMRGYKGGTYWTPSCAIWKRCELGEL